MRVADPCEWLPAEGCCSLGGAVKPMNPVTTSVLICRVENILHVQCLLSSFPAQQPVFRAGQKLAERTRVSIDRFCVITS